VRASGATWLNQAHDPHRIFRDMLQYAGSIQALRVNKNIVAVLLVSSGRAWGILRICSTVYTLFFLRFRTQYNIAKGLTLLLLKLTLQSRPYTARQLWARYRFAHLCYIISNTNCSSERALLSAIQCDNWQSWHLDCYRAGILTAVELAPLLLWQLMCGRPTDRPTYFVSSAIDQRACN
jgi:hypothetical protein